MRPPISRYPIQQHYLRVPKRAACTRQHPRQLYLRASNYRAMATSSSPTYQATVSSPTQPSAIPEEAKSKPHHNTSSNGKITGFNNPWPSYRDFSGPKILTKLLWRMITGKSKTPDTTPPTVPVHAPTFLPSRTSSEKLRVTWLGHACFYVEFASGLRVLFDPVFTERCSPFSFMGPKRYTEIPCEVDVLPFVDVVCISHNHYDHLSHPTITKIATKYPEAQFFIPLGNKTWFEKNGVSGSRVTELDWWEERDLKLASRNSSSISADSSGEENVKAGEAISEITANISCVPCQHTSARTGWDKSRTLWGSWIIASGGKKIYFAGDTGYRTVPDELPRDVFDYSDDFAHLPHCPAFKQIGELRGPFDLGLIPIGAYDPRFIMSPMHANPYDSANIFVDTKCEHALGMHWGTWVLTEEDVLEPPRLLKEALKWKGVERGEERFGVCDIGHSREY
ncbi:Metallo-hydrolase/oxidoreductase [Polychaeton citri CBS 116435]|uniref:Metallo-hydrolase/oxidoreductase n=1 Tax=Polychaeton citri CBS 116435 TaxID=1314669 RepID=A0A9P4ULU2_9PEZI|nr:Metallo-hydrolase/oxidoreductase [Polychaeton citri CBS 116435]